MSDLTLNLTRGPEGNNLRTTIRLATAGPMPAPCAKRNSRTQVRFHAELINRLDSRNRRGSGKPRRPAPASCLIQQIIATGRSAQFHGADRVAQEVLDEVSDLPSNSSSKTTINDILVNTPPRLTWSAAAFSAAPVSPSATTSSPAGHRQIVSASSPRRRVDAHGRCPLRRFPVNRHHPRSAIDGPILSSAASAFALDREKLIQNSSHPAHVGCSASVQADSHRHLAYGAG